MWFGVIASQPQHVVLDMFVVGRQYAESNKRRCVSLPIKLARLLRFAEDNRRSSQSQGSCRMFIMLLVFKP